MQDLDLIHSYTRQEAIDDGVLVDVSEIAREAGFKFPVALTRAVYEDCVAWDESDNKRKGTLQDMDGRLWDVVYMARVKARTVEASEFTYQLYRVPRKGKGAMPRQISLKAVIGPGDTPDPVITIMEPNED